MSCKAGTDELCVFAYGGGASRKGASATNICGEEEEVEAIVETEGVFWLVPLRLAMLMVIEGVAWDRALVGTT